MIRVSNVTHHYGIRPVLRNFSMQVETGELVTVLGPNGMGKSTLLGVLAGTLQPLEGYVEIDGRRRRSSVENERAIRRQVYYLPDHAFLLEATHPQLYHEFAIRGWHLRSSVLFERNCRWHFALVILLWGAS